MRAQLLSIVAGLMLVLTSGGVAAQEATPVTSGDGDSVEGSEFQTLAQTRMSGLPEAPLFVGLVRFTFPAGAATPAGADPGAVLAYVESGSLVASIDGAATITPGTDGAPTPIAEPNIELQPGDAVVIPAGTSSSFRNEARQEATAVIVMLFPEDPFGSFARVSLDGVRGQLLAGGMVSAIPSPAGVVLVRQTYAPGAVLEPTESLGPVLGVLERGRLTYLVETGESLVTRAGVDGKTADERQMAEEISAPAEIELVSGDAFVEETGTVSGARNDGNAPAELLAVFVWPPETIAPAASPVATPEPA